MLSLFAALLTLATITTAEVTIPKPPTPPSTPTMENAVLIGSAEEADSTTVRFTRLDSIQTIRAQAEKRLQELREIEKELEASLPPISRRQQTYRQDEVDTHARPIRRSIPQLASNIEIQFVVTPEGTTRDVRVLSASSEEATRIVESVAGWRFVPAIRNGRRVPSSITTTIRVSDR